MSEYFEAKTYVNLPVKIQAIQWDGTFESHFDVISFCGDKTFITSHLKEVTEYLCMSTDAGEFVVSPKDYIIKGVKGEFYPCKPDIFEMTYKEVIE